MRVFINPGHAPNGVPDPGACRKYNGELVRESDIAASVGFAVVQYLQEAGVECMLYQNDSLGRITERANLWGSDLFVSIHVNAGGGVGTETFCYALGGRSHWLADCIQKQIISSCDMVDRGVKQANYYVLRETTMSACLVELGFVDSSDIEKLLTMQDDFARAIARGITDCITWIGD